MIASTGTSAQAATSAWRSLLSLVAGLAVALTLLTSHASALPGMSRSTAKSLTPLVGTKKFITAKDEYSFKGRRLTGRILHITDMHIDQFYKAHSDPKQACHRFNVDPSRNVAGPYGHLGIKCDAPVSLINATFDFLTASGLNDVDMVIYTGDTARHDWDKTELPRTAEQALEAHHIALDRMLNAFDTSKIPIITTIGNNDPLVSE
ncbi:hypothetical protein CAUPRSCDRAFT_12464, partial [Caulochytrium protostelioides]